MELHFTKTNGPVDEAIDNLMELAGHVHHPEIIREMILAALKVGQEQEHPADLKLMNSTMKEMRFTSKVFGPYHSFGINIRLPFEQKPNPVMEGNPRQIEYKYFFNRKVAFLKEASAIALFPGGFGTLDEAMETVTLLQTGKRNPIPLLLIDEPDGTYWSRWLRFFEQDLLTGGDITASDFYLFENIDAADDAVET